MVILLSLYAQKLFHQDMTEKPIAALRLNKHLNQRDINICKLLKMMS